MRNLIIVIVIVVIALLIWAFAKPEADDAMMEENGTEMMEDQGAAVGDATMEASDDHSDEMTEGEEVTQ